MPDTNNIDCTWRNGYDRLYQRANLGNLGHQDDCLKCNRGRTDARTQALRCLRRFNSGGDRVDFPPTNLRPWRWTACAPPQFDCSCPRRGR